ncbi:flagellar filament capping protein FliD [Alishewanella sp. d11]|uniref:flagellar filament capping protein FliD n=1 Tax=Alishewanella sp. d11 TaxID=3414030 RepID=UPI003BF846C6
MSNINFLGSASGLPLNELVTTFVQVERDSRFARINTTKKTLDASLSGFGRLKSALSTFQTSLKQLTANNLNARSATVTQPTENKTYIEATASRSASAANFDIKVNQLATGSRLESANAVFTSSDDVVATSDSILTFTAGDKTFDIEVTANMTLNQLRQKINQSTDNFGVNANIINAGGTTGTKLVFTSSVTGDGNGLVVSNNNSELDTISSGQLITSQASQDAIIEVDGIVARSSSNTFTNTIQDVSIVVKAETPAGNNAQLAIATDKDQAKQKIEEFITSYNALVDQISSLTRPRTLGSDGKTVTSEGGALSADPMPRNLMSQMRAMLGGNVADADPSLSTLYALGITFNKDGKLEIAGSTEFGGETGRQRFDKALDENFDNIAKLFDGENGISTQLDNFIKEFSQAGGLIATKEQSIRTQLDKNTKDAEAASRYIASYEESMRKRYTALDSLLASLQRTQSNITGALSSLPGFVNNAKS